MKIIYIHFLKLTTKHLLMQPNFKTTNSSKKILLAIMALLIAYFISYLMLKGIGAPRAFLHTMMLVYLITLCSSSKKVFSYFVLPLTIIYALYTPIGFTYGAVSYDFLIAGFATDLMEAGEFLHQVPYKNYLLTPIIIGGLLLYRAITTKHNIHFFRNRTFLFTALLIMLAGQAPLSFISQIKKGTEKIYTEQQKLNSLIQEQSWGESSLATSEYDNYILIIGESARRDYHYVYGYPINNTPFMSSTKGIIVDGLASGGSSTVPSLKAMLTFSDKQTWDADYSKTLVGLVNTTNIETYWLSNQGYFGTYDTPISSIAKESNNAFFLKLAASGSYNISDFNLLENFKKIISRNPTEKKLIVIHLYGSHPDACNRVKDYHLIQDIKDPFYNYVNCYISSIHKTDKFLEMIHSLLIQNYTQHHSSFSMLYFADHGMAHREINGHLYLNNNKLSKFHYDVPLFMTSSNSETQLKCNSFKSGLNFTNGLANWIGIKNKYLDPDYSLFDCKDDPNDFGLSQRLEGLKPDYPVDLRDK